MWGGVGWDGWLVIVVAIRSCDRRPSLLRMAAMIDSRCSVLFKKCTVFCRAKEMT